jgi:AbrB family looped-hinge helix DNA binding protein
MKVTVKGQVTIPKEFREKHGIAPGTEVAFKTHDGHLVIEPTLDRKAAFEAWVNRVAGSSDTGLTTDEIMQMTRGED